MFSRPKSKKDIKKDVLSVEPVIICSAIVQPIRAEDSVINVVLPNITIKTAKNKRTILQTAFIVGRRAISPDNVQPIKKGYTEKEDPALDVGQSGTHSKTVQSETPRKAKLQSSKILKNFDNFFKFVVLLNFDKIK